MSEVIEVTEPDVRALLRKLAAGNNLMRLPDGTIRYLPYTNPAPWGDVVPLALFRASLRFLEGTWAPEGCDRFQLNQRGRHYLAANAETV